MNLILMGPQGSGKGTQAKLLSEKLKLAHISTGDLLRSSTGSLKKEIDACINAGNLVPNELIIKILKEKLEKEECKNGFILDGFPRTIKQAKALDKITIITKVIEISISDEEAVNRIGTRLSCSKCGSVFNTTTNPPKKEGICDSCNSSLIKRDDDTEEAIRKRLQVYHTETEQVLSHYPNISIKIDGNKPIKQVEEDIEAVLR